jgi:glycosyltransferase involved in cell wall biosynthesis
MIKYLRPDLVCVQSADNRDYLAGLGCRVAVLPSGVDLCRFQPIADRRQLRQAYRMRGDLPVVLHVGHLQAGRGVRVLGELAQSGACQVVLVVSTSTEREEELAAELRAAGVVVWTEFVPRIEEFYQLADCYVFPVTSTDRAIEVPLSVLEALACDLPVVTTRFAGLPTLFAGTTEPGLVFVDTPQELVGASLAMCAAPRPTTRHLVAQLGWESIAERLLDQALASPVPVGKGRSRSVVAKP